MQTGRRPLCDTLPTLEADEPVPVDTGLERRGALMTEQSVPAGGLAEAKRLQALAAAELLDSGAEESFDRFTRLASRFLGVPVSLVSLVDDQRQYFKSMVGLCEPWASRRQTPLSHSFCRHVVMSEQPLLVSDARNDPRVRDNPAVSELAVVAYLGIPLRDSEGFVLGSFCAIDDDVRQWNAEEVAVMEDLAAAVMAEIELRRLSRTTLERYVELQRLENQRDEMVHMLVHDMRNPLASALAALDMLDVIPGLSEQHSRFIRKARKGGKRLLELINETLTVSRSEAGHSVLAFETLRQAPLLEAAVEELASLALSAGIRLEARTAGDLPAFQGDSAKLHRVLVNLVGNALAHTPRGGEVRISVAWDVSEQALLFSVADTGKGVPRGLEARIFEKFEQAGLEAQQRESGFGLGLPFCRTVVLAHHGRIWVDSVEGAGADFRFTIPVAPVNALRRLPPPSSAARAAAQDAASPAG